MESKRAAHKGGEVAGKAGKDLEQKNPQEDCLPRELSGHSQEKTETVSRYLLGSSCMRMQRHRALDDAKLAAMIWLEMGKI